MGEAPTPAVGDANPSGRLPETWPLRLEDTPCYLDYPVTAARPTTGRRIRGYRWYDARKMPVLWPFGHGLSYTWVCVPQCSGVSGGRVWPRATGVRVRVSVKNVGMMPGKEVVQLYVADCTGTTGRRPRNCASS